MRYTHSKLDNVIWESKCIVISFKKHDKIGNGCYELKPFELGKRTNSCIRINTRELDRNLFTN